MNDDEKKVIQVAFNFGTVTGNILQQTVVTPEAGAKAKAKAKAQAKAQAKAKAAEMPKEAVRVTFTRGTASEAHMGLVYQVLFREGWIADKKPDNFLKLFSGDMTSVCVTWTDKVSAGNLAQLFKLMESHGYIKCPPGYKVNRLLESHFKTPDGQYIHNIKGGNKSEKALAVIGECQRMLDTEI